MNLFVARLNPGTTTKDLQKLFEHYGAVINAKVIFDHVTGRSKGYGFVEMPNNHEAHEALKELDNTSFHQNYISVKESVPPHYRISTMDSGFRNRNSFRRNLPESNRGTSPNNSQREYSSRRNYGYRGIGFRDFR